MLLVLTTLVVNNPFKFGKQILGGQIYPHGKRNDFKISQALLLILFY